MTTVTKTSIGASFHNYFRPLIAKSEKNLDKVYRIRYQVYCQEFNYDLKENISGQQERDLYDDHSIHCLMRSEATGNTAGCVRLVLTSPDNPDAPLPFEKYCGHSLYRSTLDPATLPRDRIGEISRLAVLPYYRRRYLENSSPYGISEAAHETQSAQRHFPYIPLGLYLSAASLGLLSGLQGVFAMMDPRLARHLRGYGIRFMQVGDVTNYHGLRAPYYIDRELLLHGLKPDMHDLLMTIMDDMRADMRRKNLRMVK